MEKPTLPKGTRDFGPAVMAKRQFIFDAIRRVFQTFGFLPLETPAMENLSTLTGKYGEEGDQLLYRIVDSGDFFKEVKKSAEIDPFQSQKIDDILRILSIELESQKNQGKFNFSLDCLPHIIKAIDEFLPKIDFSKSHFGNYLKDFISSEKEKLAYKIVSEQNENQSSQEHLDPLKEFFKNVYFIAEKFKNEFESKNIASLISQKGLRYDLTVPFARFVVMSRNEVIFPFKRYQIQPVWRADRPQKGRYREFYQCDADVVGTESLLCEAEIILMIKEVFKILGIADYSIRINHRGVLNGVAEVIGTTGKETSLFVAIDKLDKIGEEKVKEELEGKGFSQQSLTQLFEILNVKGSTAEKLNFLKLKFKNSDQGNKGIQDLEEVFHLLKGLGSNDTHVDFDIPLARGLSYYTGCIFEVKINNVSIGSVSGGGRYDNLTQAFGDKEKLPGVGFSFGVDRLYDAMDELKIFPGHTQVSSRVLICHFDKDSMSYGLGLLTTLREAGIASEIYPDTSKIKKQLDYANKKQIPYAMVIGSEEVSSGLIAFKNLETGEQEKFYLEQIIQQLKK